MANAMICAPVLGDNATLSASDGTASMPVTNLQRKQLYDVWRPGGLTPWLEADLGAAREVRSLALISVAATENADGTRAGGMSASGTWRIRAADAQGDLTAAPGYDSGAVAFRQSGAADTHPVLTGFHWMGQSGPLAYRWWRVDIDDTGNAAGYVDFGRLYISAAEPFAINMSYGAGLGFEDPSIRQRSAGGQLHAVARVPIPVAEFEIKYGSEAEMIGAALDLDRARGQARDVLCLLDHARASLAAQRTIYGLMSTDLVRLPYFRLYSKRYRIEGLLP